MFSERDVKIFQKVEKKSYFERICLKQDIFYERIYFIRQNLMITEMTKVIKVSRT